MDARTEQNQPQNQAQNRDQDHNHDQPRDALANPLIDRVDDAARLEELVHVAFLERETDSRTPAA